MEAPTLALFFLFSTLFTIIAVRASATTARGGLPLPLHFLKPPQPLHGISCQSWRLAVETNNLRKWKTVPTECENYIGHYMLGHLYRDDSKVVVEEAITYAQSLNLSANSKNAWVFDVDETVLSNLPYYAESGFGVEPYNATRFNKWVELGKAPALPESWRLYQKLLYLGIRVVFLTGRPETQRDITEANLRNAGYRKWEKLILRQSSQNGQAAVLYKSSERTDLLNEGYTIVGNIGDQWSDLLGVNEGQRTFKLPDPMYYIG